MRQNGFTLVETIVTVVLVGIMGAMLVVFLGQKLTASPDTLRWAEDASAVEDTMERIVSDFVVAMNSNSPASAVNQIVADHDDYEDLLGATVDFSWVTYDASGAEQAGGAGDSLKVEVYMDDNGNKQHLLTTVLPTTRVQSSDEAVNF